MILKAARELNLDLSRSWMIGDRWRDVDCGVNAAVRTVFVDFHYALYRRTDHQSHPHEESGHR